MLFSMSPNTCSLKDTHRL